MLSGRVTKCEVGLVTWGGKGSADTRQCLPTALTNDPSSKVSKKNQIRVGILISKEGSVRVWGVLLLVTPARHTQPCSSAEVWGLADWKLGLSLLGLDPAGLGLKSSAAAGLASSLWTRQVCSLVHSCSDTQSTGIQFSFTFSLGTTADRECIQASALHAFSKLCSQMWEVGRALCPVTQMQLCGAAKAVQRITKRFLPLL